ncbi:hypothetical protein HYE32_00935 [Mycoplasmopsis bovis]|nr:hypothetical protein [Mycoplasmopsis bovis]QQH22211.1 hypothetical protein HYE32_00935 [Mycoplasmopsis bovis]
MTLWKSNAYEYDGKPEENAKEIQIPFDLQANCKRKNTISYLKLLQLYNMISKQHTQWPVET